MTDKKRKNNTYAVPAVDGMLDIVEYLAQSNTPCGVAQLARELGLSTNLVFRVMKRLVERNYAETDGSNGYQLSTGFFSLGMKLYSRFELRRQALPFLRKLCQSSGETCQLQAPDGDRMLAIEVITPDSEYFMQVVPGSRVLYHPNAFGKCILANMDETEVERILPKRLDKLTENTITSKAKFKKELEKVRRQGLAHDCEEYVAGIHCISSPIFNTSGEVIAAAGITGLSSRMTSARIKILNIEVKNCAAAISKNLGYSLTEV